MSDLRTRGRILVTGGAGLIGSCLTDVLVVDVAVVDNFSSIMPCCW